MPLAGIAEKNDSVNSRAFHLWVASDSHLDGDLKKRKRPGGDAIIPRESLAEAIRQSEGYNNDAAPAFDWHIGLLLGDFSGTHAATPSEAEGREVVRQFGSLRTHKREDIYTLIGNTDASPGQEWARKWIDPAGENPGVSGVDKRKMTYPIDGTWERYSFRVGNMLFLMMSDRNDLAPPIGKQGKQRGNYPAGAVTMETFEWWKKMVESNPDSIIISAHHHMLRDTTVASDRWEGYGVGSKEEFVEKWQRLYPEVPFGERTPLHPEDWRYHGYFPDGAPEGASYLYFVGDRADAGLFESYLEEHPGAIDIWLGGHTHSAPGDTFGDKSHVEKKWGVNFINVAALTKNLVRKYPPNSRLLSFSPGSNTAKVAFYMHDDQLSPRGWYAEMAREIELGKPFEW
ncbi:hypothetical protein NOR51B_572 [Luminiphilus syltensis NOR5-1B]|uniref:Calcineurin-like phosphoesterase domain-containing protein n=1 Tax=Luminiphilus syltensis NOR5-1B TaxID=565045 RepID=B8KV79_9GAMM|nr:hypothetical protein NOR51B_572 [Luminiphilus syltensis NOR5-1B]